MLPCRHGEVVDAVPLARSHRPHGPGKRAWRDQDLQSQSPSRWSPEYGVTAATHPTAFDDGRSGRPHHHLRCLGNQAVAQLLGHELHVRGAETQFRGDLPVGQVQTHEVEAQHPDPQRLVVPGQHCPAEVVKARRARLAAIPLPMRLRLVMPVPDHRVAAASRVTDALWPAVLAHKAKHFASSSRDARLTGSTVAMMTGPPCSPATADRLKPSSYLNPPPQASITPEADKSLTRYTCGEPLSFPVDLTGSVCTAGTLAVATQIHDVARNETNFAIISFAPGESQASFAGAAQHFISGDVLTITPRATDTALAQISGYLAGRG